MEHIPFVGILKTSAINDVEGEKCSDFKRDPLVAALSAVTRLPL